MFYVLSTSFKNSVAPGLPNITATWQVGYGGQALGVRASSGAVYANNKNSGTGASRGSGSPGNEFAFSGAKSSKLYGASKSVTPLSQCCLFLIKY